MTDERTLYQLIGHRLRKVRSSKKLSQDKVAKKAGLSRTSITNIEHGRHSLLVHTLFRLAGALEVEPLELIADAAAAMKRGKPELRFSVGVSNKEKKAIKPFLEKLVGHGNFTKKN